MAHLLSATINEADGKAFIGWLTLFCDSSKMGREKYHECLAQLAGHLEGNGLPVRPTLSHSLVPLLNCLWAGVY